MTVRERGVVERLVVQLGGTGEPLRAQLREARVRTSCDCGCPSLEFVLPDGAVPARTRILADAYVASPVQRGAGLVLWAGADGHLAELEAYGTTRLPTPGTLFPWGTGPGPA